MIRNYNKIDSIVNDYLNLTKYKGVLNRSDMKYTANRVLKKLLDTSQYTQKIGLFDIKDYKINKPDEIYKIVQLSYKDTSKKKIKTYEIEEYVLRNYPKTGCDIKITKDCDDCIDYEQDCNCDSQKMVINIDRLWDLSHPEFRYNHMSWLTGHGGLANGPVIRSQYHNQFKVIGCTSDPLFALESHVKGCLNINPKAIKNEVQYRVENEVIRFNVKEGQVLLSYLGRPVDEFGYLLVPDLPSVYDAITWTIEENMQYQKISEGDNKAQLAFTIASQKRLEAMGRARAELRTTSYNELWKELGKYWGKKLPVEDHRGNVIDQYDQVMNRLSRN